MSRRPRARYPAREQMIYLTSTKAEKTLYSNGSKPLSPSLESSNQQGDSGSSFPVAKRKRAPNGVW